MTDLTDINLLTGRKRMAGWPACIAAAMIVSPVIFSVTMAAPAHAQAGPMDTLEDAGPADSDISDIGSDIGPDDDSGPDDENVPSDMGDIGDAPAKAVSLAEDPEIARYGPPKPKASKGQLPPVSWTEPDSIVPPALDEAVNIVGRSYPSVQAARAALRASASDVKAAKWLRFPSVQGDIAYLNNSTGSPEPQLIIEAPIWAGGRIGANIRRAKAFEDVSSAQYVETIQDLALTTSQTYFEIARLTHREQLFAASLEEHLRLVGTMERRVQQEVSPVADLELARSRAAQIEQEYTISKSQRRTALRIFAELVSDPDYNLGPIPFYEPEEELANRGALEDQAVAFDPTLQRLRGEADVARADLDVRKAAVLPQLNAQYSYDDFFGSRVGVVVRSQTTGGLSQFSEITSARIRIQSALENIRLVEQQLRRDIASSIIQYEAARERAAISDRSVTTATRVSASYMRQFIAGRRSWLDVMNALREAVTAQVGKSDAEITAMATASSLLLQSGRWRPVFEGPASQ